MQRECLVAADESIQADRWHGAAGWMSEWADGWTKSDEVAKWLWLWSENEISGLRCSSDWWRSGVS